MGEWKLPPDNLNRMELSVNVDVTLEFSVGKLNMASSGLRILSMVSF